jgi:branched-chain amino acid transport system ATP-binding protein
VDRAEPMLEVSSVRAYYEAALALEDVSLTVGRDPVAIIGRNGMGKSTLCRAVAGIQPPRVEGSIRFRICQSGIGYVPQGRRLFGSLTTDEHLRMISPRLVRRGRWSAADIYELFPRLAERRKLSAAQLSGGEQQMLAIGRALVTNPELLVMDEPSEGLAPRLVEELTETCRTLIGEGVGLLLVEQNLGMATALAERILVMVAGGIALETTAEQLADDEEAQRRYLGVEPLAAGA